MLIPKSVLKVQRASLMSKPTNVLLEMLEHQKRELNKLRKESSQETYDYLHFSIMQKITLIEDELNKRNQELSTNI